MCIRDRFCFCFQMKFQVQSRLSTVKTPIMSELKVNTMHLRKKTQINTCTCMVKYHVPACITLHNCSSNSSDVAEVIDHCLYPSTSLNGTELKGCQSKADTQISACCGHPMEQGRTLYFHPVIYIFYLFSSPNLSGRRLDVNHTSTHGVALVRI